MAGVPTARRRCSPPRVRRKGRLEVLLLRCEHDALCVLLCKAPARLDSACGVATCCHVHRSEGLSRTCSRLPLGPWSSARRSGPAGHPGRQDRGPSPTGHAVNSGEPCVYVLMCDSVSAVRFDQTLLERSALRSFKLSSGGNNTAGGPLVAVLLALPAYIIIFILYYYTLGEGVLVAKPRKQ